jgi:RNA-binding protein
MLKGFQRKYLRSQAHRLDPVVMVGKGGLSAGVIQKIDKSLDDHELIKIRFLEYQRDDKKEMCDAIEKSTYAVCAGLIGHVGIFYREHSDPEKRRFHLPQQADENDV